MIEEESKKYVNVYSCKKFHILKYPRDSYGKDEKQNL